MSHHCHESMISNIDMKGYIFDIKIFWMLDEQDSKQRYSQNKYLKIDDERTNNVKLVHYGIVMGKPQS